MRTRLLSISIVVLLLCGCQRAEPAPEDNDGRVKFTSGVTAATTKVSGTDGNEWEGNENIGVYMVNTGTTNIAESALNIQYSAGSSGTSTEFTSTTPIYYPVDDTQKVDFIAYYPYEGLTSDFTYKISLTNQANQSNIDLMLSDRADNSGVGYDKTNSSAVNLNFRHQLSKVILNVTAGDGISNLTGLSVIINGMNATADFDLSGTNGITNPDISTGILPYMASESSFEAILLPVLLTNAHTVTFTLNDNTYEWTMSDNTGGVSTLEGGNRYTFNITITKIAVQATGTITPWNSVDKSEGTAS